MRESNKPLVSIVTPCYNGEYYLHRFLESILNQTYPNIELIVVNDGSTDHTFEVIESYQDAFLKRNIQFVYLYQENSGQAAALNTGIKKVAGKYLTWLDSDDEISSNFIEKRVEFLEGHPNCVFCYGPAVAVLESDPQNIIKYYGKRSEKKGLDFFKDILYVRDIFYSGYMARTSTLDQVVTNREIYCGQGGQNAQLLLPLGWYYGEPAYVDGETYKYYVRETSHSHSLNAGEKIIEQLYNYEKILLNTIDKMDDEKVKLYIDEVKHYYARARFGNAVDTKNAELIRKQYLELKRMKLTTMKDYYLYMKYTSKLLRCVCGVKNVDI